MTGPVEELARVGSRSFGEEGDETGLDLGRLQDQRMNGVV